MPKHIYATRPQTSEYKQEQIRRAEAELAEEVAAQSRAASERAAVVVDEANELTIEIDKLLAVQVGSLALSQT